MKLRLHNYTIVIGVTSIICCASVFFGYRFLLHYSQSIELSNDLVSVEQKILSNTFNGVGHIVQVLIKSDEVVHFTNNQAENKKVIGAILNNSNQILKSSIVYIMDTLGNVLVSTTYFDEDKLEKSLEGKNYSFRPYFKKAMQGKKCIYPAVGITTQKRGIYFSNPIKDNLGNICGVLVVKMDVNNIQKTINEYDNDILLTSPEGVVFVTNKERWLYNQLIDNERTKLTSMANSRQFYNKSIKPLPFDFNASSVEIDSVDFQVKRRTIEDTKWQMIVLAPTKSMFELNIEFKKILIMGLVLIIVILSMLLLVINNVRRRKIAEIRYNELKEK